MGRMKLPAAAAMGIVLGAVLFNAPPAKAAWLVIDPASIAQEIKQLAQETGILDVLNVMNTVQNTISSTMTAINTAIGNTSFGSVTQLLQQGFTQESNYAKATVGANEQIADASNTAMARFDRDLRNAQIRDEQIASPTACAAIDGGVSAQAASVQAFGVAAVISHIHDERGEAAPGMPSHFGEAQGVASMAQEHLANYCDQDDQAAGLCPNGLSATPDADQQVLSLFGSGTYTSQTAVNTAKDFAINLIEPVAPAALRGDQLSSAMGQDAAVRRRSYNARMSLAQGFVDTAIGMQTPSVPLTASQKQYLRNLGLPAQTNGSWLQVLQIEAERRVNGVTWNAELQSMPPASVEREVALELALTNYLLFQTYKVNLQHTTIAAAQLAEHTDHDFMPTSRMPSPSIH